MQCTCPDGGVWRWKPIEHRPGCPVRIALAAPDLLAALEEVARCLNVGRLDRGQKFQLVNIARAAIARAKGESK